MKNIKMKNRNWNSIGQSFLPELVNWWQLDKQFAFFWSYYHHVLFWNFPLKIHGMGFGKHRWCLIKRKWHRWSTIVVLILPFQHQSYSMPCFKYWWKMMKLMWMSQNLEPCFHKYFYFLFCRDNYALKRLAHSRPENLLLFLLNSWCTISTIKWTFYQF